MPTTSPAELGVLDWGLLPDPDASVVGSDGLALTRCEILDAVRFLLAAYQSSVSILWQPRRTYPDAALARMLHERRSDAKTNPSPSGAQARLEHAMAIDVILVAFPTLATRFVKFFYGLTTFGVTGHSSQADLADAVQLMTHDRLHGPLVAHQFTLVEARLGLTVVSDDHLASWVLATASKSEVLTGIATGSIPAEDALATLLALQAS